MLPLVIEGVKITFLNPPGTEGLKRISRNRMWANNTSLVLKLQFRNISFLLPGDIGQEAEYRMMREGYPQIRPSENPSPWKRLFEQPGLS